MDLKTVAPLVLTSTVLSGVFTVIGNHLSAVWRDRKTLKTKGDLSALRVSNILEKFASDCANRAITNQNYTPSGMPEGLFTNVPKPPVYPDDIDWQAMGIANAQPILDFGLRVGEANDHLSDMWPFDEWGTVDATAPIAIEFGREALELSANLREKRNLDQRRPWRTEWNTRVYLDEQWQAIIVKEEEAAQLAAKPKRRARKAPAKKTPAKAKTTA